MKYCHTNLIWSAKASSYALNMEWVNTSNNQELSLSLSLLIPALLIMLHIVITLFYTARLKYVTLSFSDTNPFPVESRQCLTQLQNMVSNTFAEKRITQKINSVD